MPIQEHTKRSGVHLSLASYEYRKPLFRLVNLSGQDSGSDLYFVNDSDQTLISVTTATGGFTTADDDVFTLQQGRDPVYREVPPGEGVKVKEFDGYYDLDYLFQARIHIHCPKLGKLEVVSSIEKGSIPDQELLWDTLEPGKHGQVIWCDDEGNERQG
ncbi:hypothetical protein [Pelovirga terrestris]|uniref:Uncharacterized protein n=1 Tax=Pelovirga terrestris TaxID=2771352 RepID=A0A8J6QU81_9BACT|nr:hypothetical protein [Pelovirga terrestris]MBD1399995.1 hypothetical protein [Pelovirga terrestris]